MTKPMLVTGARGQVGCELAEICEERGWPVVALDHSGLDIANPAAVARSFKKHKPWLVVNAAAYTAVDRAESQPELATKVNRDGPANLARACEDLGIPLFHLSTDYVFNGEKTEPYVEEDETGPVGVYGQSKLEGEIALRNACQKHLILRVAWVFGRHGHNFVRTMVRVAQARDHIRVVNDQRGGPTPAYEIAMTLMDLAERHREGQELPWGTYHYCGQPTTTWAEFASEIFKAGMAANLLKKAPTLEPVPTSEYPTAARRPMNSVLDCSRFQAAFGIEQPDWRGSLWAVLENWDRADALI
jgi:dTDP-4-dehydrorhamnose reductase